MAVQTGIVPDQLVSGYRRYPIDNHGKLRFDYMSMPALAAQADIGSTILFFDLPPGRVRVLPWLSRFTCSAWGAGATLAIGYQSYVQTQVSGSAAIAASVNDLMAATSFAAAQAAVAWSTVMKFDLYSVAGIRVQGTIAGANVPVGATMSAMIAYLYE